VLYLFNEPHYIWTEIFLSFFVITGIPIFNLIIGHTLFKVPALVSTLIDVNDNRFALWLKNEKRKMLSPAYFPMWAIAIQINILGTLTLLLAGLPFQSLAVKLFVLIAIQPTFFFCGQAGYIVVVLAFFYYRLVRWPLITRFYQNAHRPLGDLSRITFVLALMVLLGYLGLLGAVTLSPYSASPWMIPWLTSLAIAPFFSYSWGMYQVHVLQRELKLRYLDMIGAQVQRCFDAFKMNPSQENAEILAQSTGIQKQIEDTREWPTPIGTVLTFILAAAAAFGQLIASIVTLFK
jgi:hypothetical protein